LYDDFFSEVSENLNVSENSDISALLSHLKISNF